MIPKGNQRGGGRQLATHLLNEYDNDRVEVLDTRGSVADDLHGAFAEWHAQSRATRCREYLYSLSINPDHRQQEVERRHYLDYIERVEQRLGLAEQPRAIVLHVKNGREHCHVVWSRIDAENGRAVQVSYDRQTLRSITQEYARDYGLELPKGAREDRGKDRFDDKRKRETQAEKSQQKRTGISKEERSESLTAAWRGSDNGKAFVQALAERGYYLARGDESKAKRSRHLVVDMYGEVHSLARQIKDVNTAGLRERLRDIREDALPSIEDARQQARKRLEARQQEKEKERTTSESNSIERRNEFGKRQAERREALDGRRDTLNERQNGERTQLADMQKAEWDGLATARAARAPGRVGAFLQRITGIQRLIASREQTHDASRAAQHKETREALSCRHKHERQDVERRYRALAAIEERERTSFETDQRRENLPKLAAKSRTQLQPTLAKDAFERVKKVERASHEEPKQAAPRLSPALEEPAKSSFARAARSAEITTEEPRLRGRLAAFFGGIANRLRRDGRPQEPLPQEITTGEGRAKIAEATPAYEPAPQSALRSAYNMERAAKKESQVGPSRRAGQTREPELSP